MDRKYPWKRAEETEIDLADLLKQLCRQWKQMVLCALACTFLLGGYGWISRGSMPEADTPGLETETDLTKEEEQKVADAVWLETEIRGLETYLNHSVLMNLDPYHKNKVVMLYWIDQAQKKELPVIAESYLNFALNGSAADALLKSGSWNLDKSCLAELIAAYQKTSSFSNQIVMDSQSENSMAPGSFFYVEITGRNAKTAEKMAQDMQDVLEDYSVQVKKNAGNHRLTLIDSVASVTADTALQSQQHDKKAFLSSNKTNLTSMTNALNEKQLLAYYKASGIEQENEQKSEKTETADSGRLYLKYMLAGFAGGIFMYCGIFFCWYMFNGQVKSTEEMHRLYAVPVYGTIALENRKQKKNGCEYAKAQVLNRIRLACKKQGIKKLYAASDFMLGTKERDRLESIALQLKEWGIEMTAAENASEDTALWDEMSQRGSVLMVCRLGLTTHRMIDHTMSFYTENDIAVIGSVVFSANG